MQTIKIKERKIGPGYPTFIIAELSGNHHQKFKEAVALIKAAAKAGVDAVKLQTYTPNTMTIDSTKPWFIVAGKDNPQNWQGKTLYELYKKAYTPWKWQPKLKKIAEDLGLILFSTPFDSTSVDFLEKMHVPCYKIASYETTDIPLLKKVASCGKPVIISVGFASLGEIKLAVSTLKNNGAKQVAILHCVTAYSNKPDFDKMNLETIMALRKKFGVVSGFSDNNSGIEIPLYAVAMGASIVEKHFILDRKSGGPDAQFSIEPDELRKMVTTIRNFEKSKGKIHYGPTDEKERYNKRFRRSIFAVADIKKGDKLSAKNIRIIRPEFGLKPFFWDKVIDKVAIKDIEQGTPINSTMFKR